MSKASHNNNNNNNNRRSGGAPPEEKYTVERIVDTRTSEAGEREYLLKWQGYGDECNTWEPFRFLDCVELVRAFEERRARDERMRYRRKYNQLSEAAFERFERGAAHGFGGGRQPEEIIGATVVEGSNELLLMVKWKGMKEADLVRAKEANDNCPQIVIRFYEKSIYWCKDIEQENTIANRLQTN